MFAEDQYVALSALQHYSFCPRRCALIHTDRCWEENALTTFGRIEHERVHTAPSSTQGGVRTARGLPLISHELGLRGQSDAVEFRRVGSEITITPVEYKHGRQQSLIADSIQLCAQALCLEEMHHCTIAEGYLYYHSLRRRTRVPFDEQLREQTRHAIISTRELLNSRRLPPPELQPHCKSCSLRDICLPGIRRSSAVMYNNNQIETSLKEQ